MSRTLPAAALAGAALGVLTPAAQAETDHERPQPRVVVADGVAGVARVLDARSGRVLTRHRLAGRAANVVTAGDGRHVLLTQPDADRVDALDAGAFTEEHGDHAHHVTVRPRLLPFRLRTDEPVHTVAHEEHLAIFADGAGAAHVFDVAALRRRARPATLPAGPPHHGVAVPFGERTIVSATDPDADLPGRLEVRNADGAVLRTFDCPDLHGETSGPGWAAFACADHLVVIRPAGTPRASAIPYPAGTGEDRAFTLRTDASGHRAVGSVGERRFVVADVRTGEARLLRSRAPIASFEVDGASRRLVALTTDGRVRRIDLRTGRQSARRVLGRRFVVDFDKPTPGLAVRDGVIAVSDPRARRVTTLRATRRLPVLRRAGVPGRPAKLALAS